MWFSQPVLKNGVSDDWKCVKIVTRKELVAVAVAVDGVDGLSFRCMCESKDIFFSSERFFPYRTVFSSHLSFSKRVLVCFLCFFPPLSSTSVVVISKFLYISSAICL